MALIEQSNAMYGGTCINTVSYTHLRLIIQPESYGATVDEGFIVGGPVGDFELLLCHGTVSYTHLPG